jgi:Fur family transcriptional regulator, ferric uptake regulator
MTVAANVQPLTFENLDDAVRALRERGLRLSSSRRMVLEALFAAREPRSAEQIASEVRLDPASVYRNLEALERIGLASHVHLGHGPGLYVLVGRGQREYLYCERCGAVRSLAPDELAPVRERVQTLFGYRARFTHHAIVGTCAKCSRRQPRARSHASR